MKVFVKLSLVSTEIVYKYSLFLKMAMIWSHMIFEFGLCKVIYHVLLLFCLVLCRYNPNAYGANMKS